MSEWPRKTEGKTGLSEEKSNVLNNESGFMLKNFLHYPPISKY